MGKAGAYTACAVLARYGYGAGLEAAVMAFTDARNDKPPMKGVDAVVGLPLRLGCRISVEGSLTDCSSSVNHPTTPTYSGTLDGETTRRVTLNLHRGGQPVGARRIVGKRKWQPEQSGEK